MASEDVLDRKAVERIAEALVIVSTPYQADDKDLLLAHDAALRDRVAELEGALEHTLAEIDNATKRNIIPFSAINAWKARRALDTEEPTDG